MKTDDFLVADDLHLRPSRTPGHEAECRLLAALADELAMNPAGVERKVVEGLTGLGRAGSAGVSVLAGNEGDALFRCHVAAGMIPLRRLASVPREGSLCAEALVRKQLVLFERPERHFAALRGITPAIHEAMIIPWPLEGEPVGTLWALCHSPEHRFDAEDSRLLRILATFIQAAWKLSELTSVNGSLRAGIAQRDHADASRQDLLRQLVNAQEEERRRVARELHDQLGQQVSVLRLRLSIMKDQAGDNRRLRQEIEDLADVARQLDSDVDFLVWQLRPTALDDLGLIDALYDYVDTWSGHFHVAAEVRTVGLNDTRLEPEIETVLYRIVQEALSNVAKHAHATAAHAVLRRSGNEVSLTVKDNGTGFRDHTPGRTPGHGHGLLGMRERVALVGGSFAVHSEPGSGTTITVRIPLSP